MPVGDLWGGVRLSRGAAAGCTVCFPPRLSAVACSVAETNSCTAFLLVPNVLRRLYGQNNVDSGKGNDIIDRDELSVSAM